MNFIGKEAFSKRKFKNLNARQLKKRGDNYLKFNVLIQLKEQLNQDYFDNTVEYFLSQIDEKGEFLLKFDWYKNKLKQEKLSSLSDLYKKQLEEAKFKNELVVDDNVSNVKFLIYELIYDMILNSIDYYHLKNKKFCFTFAYGYNGNETKQEYVENNVAYQLGYFSVMYYQEKDFHATVKKDFMDMLKEIKTTIKDLFNVDFYVENDVFIENIE